MDRCAQRASDTGNMSRSPRHQANKANIIFSSRVDFLTNVPHLGTYLIIYVVTVTESVKTVLALDENGTSTADHYWTTLLKPIKI